MLKRLWAHRGLVWTLTHRQFRLRYRQSALGFMWAFLFPAATLGAGALVFRTIADVETGGVSYTLFTMASLVPWVFFASAMSFGIGSIVQDKNLVMKLAFPRAALPLSMVGVSLVDFFIAAIVFVVLASAGDGLGVTALWVPLLLLIEVAFVVGLVLLLSALNVFARDIRLGVPLLVQSWLLITPVLYPLNAVPKSLRPWLLANPMTGVVESFRRVLVIGKEPTLALLAPTLVAMAIALIIGYWYFAATERRFADVI